MTPEDRADEIIARAAAGHLGWYEQRQLMVAAIRAAVAEEREACAGVARAFNVTVSPQSPSYHSDCGRAECAEEIEAAIRARS